MKRSNIGWLAAVGLAAALVLAGCDDEKPVASPAEPTAALPADQNTSPPTEPVRPEASVPAKTEAPAGETTAYFDAERRKLEELEKSLPTIETVLPTQADGAEGLKAVGEKMLALGQAGKLTEMQTVFKSFKAGQAELSELFGADEAGKQWPNYANNSNGFITIAEKLTADIKAGRYNQVEVVELKPEDKLPRSLSEMLTKMDGKAKAFELTLVNGQKPKDKKIYRPMVFVHGQWRYLMNVFTATAN